jgi:hypothetical protein
LLTVGDRGKARIVLQRLSEVGVADVVRDYRICLDRRSLSLSGEGVASLGRSGSDH